MRRFQRVSHLPQQKQSCRRQDTAFPAQSRTQGLACKQFHGEKENVFALRARRRLFRQIEYPANVHVRDLPRKLNLSLESRDHLFVPRYIRQERLQRDRTPELKVFRLVDLSHPAAVQETLDAITPGDNLT